MSRDVNETASAPGAAEAAYEVERLLAFALQRGWIEPYDAAYARNSLLDLLRLQEPYGGGGAQGHAQLHERVQPHERAQLHEHARPNVQPHSSALAPAPESAEEPLSRLLDYAAAAGILEADTLTHRDLFDTRLMGCLLPRPSETVRRFRDITERDGVKAATDWFYALSIDSDYIRMNRIRRNLYWLAATEFGELEITVNLSKPEKDPREIAMLKNAPSSSYPKCLLCADNVGYAGRLNHPARQTLRVIPVTIGGEEWFFQYSPYVYYNEHCIVLSGEHVPMRVTERTFERLFDFLDAFPHYFIGSNADLPIVGGSILNHDHFQGGRHVFPEEKAPVTKTFVHPDRPDVRAGIVKWPMSVVRLRSRSRESLSRAAVEMLEAWRAYSDESVDVRAFTGDTPHNTITPIARFAGDGSGEYELDLVLRNNRTSEEHPEGIFHPHRDLHHVKKENIGLIEVMGLAVLPGRLKDELAAIRDLLTGRSQDGGWRSGIGSGASGNGAAGEHPLAKHAPWIERLLATHGTNLAEDKAEALLRDEVGRIFLRVLSDAGVFKQDDKGQAAFAAFLASVGYR